MIAPIHALAGMALGKGARNRWWLALPLAFVSHQLLDFPNERIQHFLPQRLDLWIGVPGLMLVLALAWLPWRGWKPRWWLWASTAAMLPDIIDWGIMRPLGHGSPIHSFFWGSFWLDPFWAVVWLAAAIGFGLAYLSPYYGKVLAGISAVVVAVLVVIRLRRKGG